MRNICLFSDDFRKFPIGEFPYDPDHSAAGEYHYVTPKGVCGEWKDQVCNYRYNGHGPSWIVTEENGKHYMEQSRIEKVFHIVFFQRSRQEIRAGRIMTFLCLCAGFQPVVWQELHFV